MVFLLNRHLVSLIGGTLFFIGLLSCENQLPQDFQKDDDFTISDMDSKACTFLSRDTTKTDTLIINADTTFTTNRFYVPVTANVLIEPVDSLWINASDSLISSLLEPLVTDTTIVISNPNKKDTCYAFYYQQPSQSNTLYFFISWDLNNDNIDAYIEFDIFSKQGEQIQIKTSDISLETIAGCSEEVEIEGQNVIVPKIRVQNGYELDEGYYLFRFYISKPLSISTFRMVILTQS